MTDSYKEAHRYPGGITKYLFDHMISDESGDSALAARVAYLEGLSTKDISFTVKDDAGTPQAVSGATVTVAGKTGTTGAAGGCTIKDVLFGKYTVTVKKTGFNDYSDEITIDASHLSFNIGLTTASG